MRGTSGPLSGRFDDQVLEIADRRAEQAEVFVENQEQTVVRFRAGKLHSQETKFSYGLGLRLIKDGRLGFSCGSNTEVVEEYVDAALAAAALGRNAGFDFPSSSVFAPGRTEQPREVKTLDNRVLVVSPDWMVCWGDAFLDVMRARAKEAVFDLVFRRTYREITVRNSNGLNRRFNRAELELTVEGLVVDHGLSWFPDYVNLSSGEHPQVEPLADRLETLIRDARRRPKMASGLYPVIVMPIALPNLLLPLAVNVNGRHFEKKTSPLVGREGEKLLSEQLTITDNPLRSYGLNSAPFDAEGVARKRSLLFDRGVFRGFLFDLATGSACGRESTGSASRDYSHRPVPGTSNLEIAPGTARLDKLVRGMKKGLVVYGFLGGGQSNLMAGELALDVSLGYKVESGRISGMVKDVQVAGNAYELLSTVDAVGAEQQDLGGHFLPFLHFPSLKVAVK